MNTGITNPSFKISTQMKNIIQNLGDERQCSLTLIEEPSASTTLA